MIISPLVLFLTMVGIGVVAPTTVATVGKKVYSRSRAYGNVAKYEAKLRKLSKQEEKSKSKTKTLAKKYYKSMKLASRRVLPSYDNLSIDNFYLKKINKVEGKRNKLIADLGLAQIKGKTAKVVW